MHVGVSLRDYNDMTPHELNLHINAFRDKERRESEEGLTLAYLTAYWQRVKRMPDLRRIIQDNRPRKQSTDAEMLAKIKAINAAMGGTVKGGG